MRIICGYNVNLDSVYTIGGNEIVKYLGNHNMIEKVLKHPASSFEGIYSIEDFFRGLLLNMKSGSGAEWLIFNHEVVKSLKECFGEKSDIIIGGNAGNITNVLSELGASLVLPNIARHSKVQTELFHRKNIKTKTRVRNSENEESIHFVFNFNKGTHVQVGDLDFIVPHDDRFIATYDPANIALEVDPFFEEYLLQFADSFDGAIFAGFHLLLKEYSDGSTYKDKLNKFIRHAASLKKQNPNMFIHVELGYFQSDIVESYLLKNLFHVDSLGLNEVELSRCILIKDNKKLIAGINDLQIGDITMASLQILQAADLNRVCVHTGEFVVSVFKKGFIKPADEIKALRFAVRTAASYAATGKHGNLEYIEQTTKNIPLRNSKTTSLKNYYVCMVPVMRCEKPVTTVGLGDTFTAAAFLRELELAKQA
ncbi:MAG: hypothetical protein EF812_00585 [Methanosarcinales archaeon]|nr:MAG: hypothetical protein EF812_00585 [Methanosarcinales archaeon]